MCCQCLFISIILIKIDNIDKLESMEKIENIDEIENLDHTPSSVGQVLAKCWSSAGHVLSMAGHIYDVDQIDNIDKFKSINKIENNDKIDYMDQSL